MVIAGLRVCGLAREAQRSRIDDVGILPGELTAGWTSANSIAYWAQSTELDAVGTGTSAPVVSAVLVSVT
jgi:hypothetical protein